MRVCTAQVLGVGTVRAMASIEFLVGPFEDSDEIQQVIPVVDGCVYMR